MKKLFTTLCIALTLQSFPQQYYDDDCETFGAVSPGYALTKTIAVSYDYFIENGLTAFGGIAYTPKVSNKKEGAQEQHMNIVDIFAGVGYRIYQIDYAFSLYLNGGLAMGNLNPLQPFVSTKFLFPANNKAYSIEPMYVFKRGASAKFSVHFKLN